MGLLNGLGHLRQESGGDIGAAVAIRAADEAAIRSFVGGGMRGRAVGCVTVVA